MKTLKKVKDDDSWNEISTTNNIGGAIMRFMSPRGEMVSNRLASPLEEDEKGLQCSVIGCENLTRRAAQEGFDQAHCKHHAELSRKHGCSWRGSFSKSELKPYRQASERWLRGNTHSVITRSHLKAFSGWFSSRHYIWFDKRFRHVRNTSDFKYLSTILKARFKFIQMIEKGVDVDRVLIDVLAVEAASIDGRIISPRDLKWREHQVGKVLNRKAGGLKKTIIGDQQASVWKFHPLSAGGWVRLLGKYVRDQVNSDGVLSEAVGSILQATRERVDYDYSK